MRFLTCPSLLLKSIFLIKKLFWLGVGDRDFSDIFVNDNPCKLTLLSSTNLMGKIVWVHFSNQFFNQIIPGIKFNRTFMKPTTFRAFPIRLSL